MSMAAALFCANRRDGLYCDMPQKHAGRHVERWVAAWSEHGDIAYYVGDSTATGRAVYRVDAHPSERESAHGSE